MGQKGPHLQTRLTDKNRCGDQVLALNCEKKIKLLPGFPKNYASSLSLSPNVHTVLGNVTEILIQVR